MENLDYIKKIAKKCLNCKNPSCVKHCPIQNPIPSILELIENDKITDACELLFANTNGSFVCSQLCDFEKQCYGHCVLFKNNQGIKFYEVESFLSQYYDKNILDSSLKKEKVAIIGAGVSGISCAIDLGIQGYDVTIFERKSKIGGVITDSLPSFRFDESRIDKYYDILSKLCVKIIFNKEWGNNLKIEDLSSFKYIIMALGTYTSKSTLPKHSSVKNALKILQEYKIDHKTIFEKKVLVIGGGNIAIDVARTLARCDNEVKIVYRRDIKNAPASQKEIRDALLENIEFKECLAPIDLKLDFNGNLLGLVVEKMNLIKDPNSERLTFAKTGEFQILECDYIVEAIGLNADYQYTKEVFPELFNEKGWIDENKHIIKNKQVILATGDFLTGASNFVNALRVAKNTVRMVKENE